MPIRVAITDDHPMVVNGLTNMLQNYAHIAVAATFSTGEELLNGLQEAAFDVLLLDINLPGMQGTELVRIISKSYPGLRIIAVSSMDDVFHIKEMMTHGCAGYLLKKTNSDTLVKAIEQVYKGEEFLEPELKELLLNDLLKKPKRLPQHIHITKREKEILQLVVKEYSNKEIADALSLSESTVKNHRFSLLQKLDVKNSVGLARKAMELGLI